MICLAFLPPYSLPLRVSGFHELVPPELISIFTPKELELLISGLPDVDLDDLQVRSFCGHWWCALINVSAF